MHDEECGGFFAGCQQKNLQSLMGLSVYLWVVFIFLEPPLNFLRVGVVCISHFPAPLDGCQHLLLAS